MIVWSHEKCQRDKDTEVLVGDVWYVLVGVAKWGKEFHIAVKVIDVNYKSRKAEVTPLAGDGFALWFHFEELVLPRNG